MALPDFKTYTINFYNNAIVEVVSKIAYKDHRAVAVQPYYRVYDEVVRNSFGDPCSEYKIYNTPSKAASRINVLLKKAGVNMTVNYTQVKEGLDSILKTAQHAYDKERIQNRIEAFKADFEELLNKHNMHIVINEEEGDYYSNGGIYLEIKDDLMNGATHLLEDIVKTYKTTENPLF